MKKILFSTGFIVLLVLGYGFVKDRINKDYYDHRTTKLKDNSESIILKRNSKLSILKLSDQSAEHETASFEWYTGDESTFDLTDSTTFKHGTGLTGDGIEEGKLTPIEFEEYRFYWTPHMNGEGFVYLNYYPKVNAEKGPFSWTVVSSDSLTDTFIRDSASSLKTIDVKKKSILNWLSE